jgi:hypothetical protein
MARNLPHTLRTFFLICAATAALVLAGALTAPRAEALPLSAPAALNTALAENNLVDSVAYYCRRVWRCGRWGCGWRRICGWTGPAYYYAPGYYPGWRWGYYRPYRYYGWGWRRRW